jgi:hypothetical protein
MACLQMGNFLLTVPAPASLQTDASALSQFRSLYTDGVANYFGVPSSNVIINDVSTTPQQCDVRGTGWPKGSDSWLMCVAATGLDPVDSVLSHHHKPHCVPC